MIITTLLLPLGHIPFRARQRQACARPQPAAPAEGFFSQHQVVVEPERGGHSHSLDFLDTKVGLDSAKPTEPEEAISLSEVMEDLVAEDIGAHRNRSAMPLATRSRGSERGG
jgi:hypothetical protein